MINIQWGIPGFDQLTASENVEGGIPEKSTTLIYGPPKTGKSIFCNLQRTFKSRTMPLYISTDIGVKQV